MSTSRYFTHTRQLTGRPLNHHAYVYDRLARPMRPVASCLHLHRSVSAAQRCANRMLRWVLASTDTRETENEE